MSTQHSVEQSSDLQPLGFNAEFVVMSAVMAVSVSEGETGWVVVRQREKAEPLRVLRRQKEPSTESPPVLRRTGPSTHPQPQPQPQPQEKCSKDSVGFHSLVGAPIVRSRGRVDRDEQEMNRKIGGHLHLADPDPVVPMLSVTSNSKLSGQLSSDLDLSDAGEWPSMGVEKDTVPALGSWSTVVKKPVPPPVSVPQQEELPAEPGALSLKDLEKGKTKKKKKKKGSESGVTKREPLMLEFATLFQALEVKESKRVAVGTGGGLALPKPPKPQGNVSQELTRTGNPMDSSAPLVRRGKEREVPKKKRPSALRKVITKEKLDRQVERESGTTLETTEGASLEADVPEKKPTPPHSVHSRKFREYCHHVVTEEINENVEKLLSSLRHFQDRQHLKDPTKSKAKRRYVCGLREVLKHLQLKKIKCVIVPPNLDKIKSEGGIDDFVEQILRLCSEQGVPVVFAMTRRRLATLLRKKHRIGCVGIFYYDGAEVHYKKVMELIETAKLTYDEKCSAGVSISLNTELESSADSPDEEPELTSLNVQLTTSTPHEPLTTHFTTSHVHLTTPFEYLTTHTHLPTPHEPLTTHLPTPHEQVPSHSLNVNAAIFTPSFPLY